jgi:hypothetical protein
MPRLCRRLMTLMGRGGIAGRSKSIGSGRSLDASRVGRGRELCCGCRVSSARLMISKAPEVISLAHPQVHGKLTVVLKVSFHVGTAQVLPELWKLPYDSQEVSTPSQPLTQED